MDKRVSLMDEEPRAGDGRLNLGFANDNGSTRLIERSHFGPLRVQKPLYPEGAALCHAIVVHPPGGVVGGDQLLLNVSVGAGAHAVLCTPGAAKWYKHKGQGLHQNQQQQREQEREQISRQEVRLEVAAGACLEWLPQETIFFNSAQVSLAHTLNLAPDATYMGCEILCFGRTASGEYFTDGKIMQRTRIRRGGQLIWHEQGRIDAGGAVMRSPLGLAGKTVCATFIAVGKVLPVATVNHIRAALAGSTDNTSNTVKIGISQSKTVFVARYLGDSSEQARQIMLGVWQHLRPALTGRAAVVPRIWQT
jgi:urease accessory protein